MESVLNRAGRAGMDIGFHGWQMVGLLLHLYLSRYEALFQCLVAVLHEDLGVIASHVGIGPLENSKRSVISFRNTSST